MLQGALPRSFQGTDYAMYEFPKGKLEPILGAAAKILVAREALFAASILANAEPWLMHWEHDNWNGGQETWKLCLAVTTETYLGMENREDVEEQLNRAIAIPMEAVSRSNSIFTEITTRLEDDADWRRKTNQVLSGEGINNQGRAHSKNVASIPYDNLLFRSRPEVYFYRALKAQGVAFAPLSVVVGKDGLGGSSRRIEPDFVIFKDGMVTIVEIDGDLFHTETPQAAHQRLKFLLDEGARLERLNAGECDNDEKAREAVGRVLMDIEKRRRSRV